MNKDPGQNGGGETDFWLMLATPADHNIKVHTTLKEGFIIGKIEKPTWAITGTFFSTALEILHFVSPAAGVI